MEPLPSKEEMNPGRSKAVLGYLVQIYPATFDVGSIRSLRGTSWTVGRKRDCDIQLNDESISRHHARIETGSDGHWLLDLKSFNGTFVNEQRIEKSKLTDGDYVRFGNCIFRYLAGDPEEGKSQVVCGPTLDDASTIPTNATQFIEAKLASAARTKRPLSLLQIELDLGEPGDRAESILSYLATRVRSALGKDDLLARSMAGKFTVVLPSSDHDEAMRMAATLRELLENPSAPHGCRVGVRIGVVTTSGQEGLTSAELLRRANEMLRL
jgi:diguanylate cyclase (GGDEF)-like protein